MKAILTDVEDSLLAMCEGDPVTLKLAGRILGAWYERKFDRRKMVVLVNRLAKLGFVNWRYWIGSRKHFKNRLPSRRTLCGPITFKATTLGEAYLRKPREARQACQGDFS